MIILATVLINEVELTIISLLRMEQSLRTIGSTRFYPRSYLLSLLNHVRLFGR